MTPILDRQAQLTIADYAKGLAENARDHGLAAAEAGDREYADKGYAWIKRLDRGTEFDADDLRFEFGSSRASGSIFRRASRAGLITPVGISTSRAPQRHRGISRRWIRT